MYQWVDPDNGITQLSGKPPVWYRSEKGGPRVFVFENGKVIDDTGVSVTDTERDRLRQQAFLKAEEDRTRAREKLLEAKRLSAMLDKGREQPQEIVVEEADMGEEPPLPKKEAANSEEETIKEMRALIEEWEKKRTESAREALSPQGGSLLSR